MNRLLVVSNRLPVTIEKEEEALNFKASVGGLATGLSSFYKSRNGLWIGWSGISSQKLTKSEEEKIEEDLQVDFDSYPVFLSQKDVDRYYYGFCNKTLWPLFHGFPQYTVYDKRFWNAYKRVNEFFAEAVVKIADPEDTIWIHDYHLMILPRLLREKLEETAIGFFLHTPFPPCEVFRLLPWREEILEGLLKADLIGFHTYSYVRNFRSTVRRLLGYPQTLGKITAGNRVVKVDSFPMGIDYERFAEVSEKPEIQKEIHKIRKEMEDRKTIFSIDRLDYTKGIPQRLEAFDLFLEKYPEYREKVTLILAVSPSRTRVEQYKTLKREVDELISKINGRHGTIGWTPIRYISRVIPFRKLAALYVTSDIALITPLKDGMNLISKEFIATKTEGRGVLILSEMAGTAKELGEALLVNPNNTEEIAKAIKKAIEMPYEEQFRRNRRMQKRLQRYNVTRWATDFLSRLSQIKETQRKLSANVLTLRRKRELINDYREGEHRLIMLDYDGTLVPLTEKGEEAKAEKDVLNLLNTLAQDAKNEVVILSGRNKKTLDKWFKDLNVGLVAEHGAWIKKRNGKWKATEALETDWKEEIRPILELYTDRTPNSFIEEDDFSFSWHYLDVAPELASVRSKELKDTLMDLIATLTPLNLAVSTGRKVIEIKHADINKGQAASRWLSKKCNFILAIGDDWTDEDLFATCPPSTYSIKVGLNPSKSRFNIQSVKGVKSLLKTLTSC
ncbi:MAG: bifunctional alpha,alpha-trehalose-phosphate synthase (UDP-forming)/trehalose-phosphatase [Thermoproteota archaeon]